MPEPRTGDYAAICETKARYCRCMDTKDWAAFADVFAADFVLDTTGSGGFEVRGRDKAVDMIRNALTEAQTVHQVHSPEVTFVDDDTADVVWAMQDRIVWPDEKAARTGMRGLTGWGHYHERYVRESDGAWRIAAQRLTRLLVEKQPFESAP